MRSTNPYFHKIAIFFFICAAPIHNFIHIEIHILLIRAAIIRILHIAHSTAIIHIFIHIAQPQHGGHLHFTYRTTAATVQCNFSYEHQTATTEAKRIHTHSHPHIHTPMLSSLIPQPNEPTFQF